MSTRDRDQQAEQERLEQERLQQQQAQAEAQRPRGQSLFNAGEDETSNNPVIINK